MPSDGVPRQAFVEPTIEVAASAGPTDPSRYPPHAWGAGIQAVWAGADQRAAAAGHVQPVDQAFMQWAEVEPSAHGSYDWSDLDDALAEAATTRPLPLRRAVRARATRATPPSTARRRIRTRG